MAQGYDFTLPNPMVAFEQAYNFGNAIAAREAAQVKAAEERMRAQKAQEALKSVATDRSPENIARVFRDFPALKDQITASESVLNEAQKAADNELRATVIGLTRAGNLDAAKARLQKQANAYAETKGKEKEAAAAKALLETWDINPQTVILPMTLQLYQSDKDLYKTFFENAELTAFQKNLKAANIDVNSPRGIALAEAFAVNQADPLVEIMTPNNTKFVGPRSEYFRRYGENAPAPSEVAPVEAIQMLLTGQGTEAEFDAIFGKGKAAEYLKLKGVSGSNATGNFQGK